MWMPTGIEPATISFSTLFNIISHCYYLIIFIIIITSARLRETDQHPISPKTPATEYKPIDRKERKGKIVEDYSKNRAV